MEIIYSDADDLNDLLKEGTLVEKRSFIHGFVKLVKAESGEAESKYTMQVLPDNAPISKDGVLPTVPYGGRYCTKGGTFKLAFKLV